MSFLLFLQMWFLGFLYLFLFPQLRSTHSFLLVHWSHSFEHDRTILSDPPSSFHQLGLVQPLLEISSFWYPPFRVFSLKHPSLRILSISQPINTIFIVLIFQSMHSYYAILYTSRKFSFKYQHKIHFLGNYPSPAIQPDRLATSVKAALHIWTFSILSLNRSSCLAREIANCLFCLPTSDGSTL